MKNIKKLTSRQWRLYNFIKENNGFDTQQDLLISFENKLLNKAFTKFHHHDQVNEIKEYVSENGYGYFEEEGKGIDWNNMSSARMLRKDIQALQESDFIQKVIVGTKLADTVEEAKSHLEKKLIRILKQLKRYHIEKKKLEKHLQKRLQFNQERDIILAVKGEEHGNE